MELDSIGVVDRKVHPKPTFGYKKTMAEELPRFDEIPEHISLLMSVDHVALHGRRN